MSNSGKVFSPKQREPVSNRVYWATTLSAKPSKPGGFISADIRHSAEAHQLSIMHVRDATGRQVSLLNEDPCFRPLTFSSTSPYAAGSPRPITPDLARSDSYDSNTSGEAISPITPALYEYIYPACHEYPLDNAPPYKRPSFVGSTRSNSYEEDSSANSSSAADRPGKRYPCRFRDSHGCEKTFTTSGHASRHSKIHTAEKAVHCTYLGCHKKFTRADNMKQHLETHYKDKSRSINSAKVSKATFASAKRGPASTRSNSMSTTRGSVSHSHSRTWSYDAHMWDADRFSDAVNLHSPPAWATRGLEQPLTSPPPTARTSSGLDALAAIACQEVA